MTATDKPTIWLAAGIRTPFVGVDGPFAHRDSLSLSVPVVQAMAARVAGSIDFAVWGAVIVNLAYANLAREVWLESKLDARADIHDDHAMQYQHGRLIRSRWNHGANESLACSGGRRREHEPGADRPRTELVRLVASHVSGAQRLATYRAAAKAATL